jgi:hypothetical protein
MLAIEQWINAAKLSKGLILWGIDQSENIRDTLGNEQIN